MSVRLTYHVNLDFICLVFFALYSFFTYSIILGSTLLQLDLLVMHINCILKVQNAVNFFNVSQKHVGGFPFAASYTSIRYLCTIIEKTGLHSKYTLSVGLIANISLLSDFPRLDQWSENTFLSDASLFMDGFLYMSSGPAKTTLDRRGKDGERRRKTHSISVFVSH